MTKTEKESIKNELQGPKGLIRQIRAKYVPNTQDMALLAQTEYEATEAGFTDVDKALDSLLTIEYKIYLEKQLKITEGFAQYADKEATKEKHPAVRSSIDKYKNLIASGANPTDTLKEISKIFMTLADSNRQSRVSRSGSSLMHHISYLLTKSGYVEKVDYQREFVLKEGCKLDFFFPDLATYQNEPKNCCAVACQTTSNDRFRLTFAQMPSDTRNRACTAIGNSNFGDKLGPKSLTDTKLSEAKKNGVKFVIIGSSIDQRLLDSKAVISYEDWFQELETLKPFW